MKFEQHKLNHLTGQYINTTQECGKFQEEYDMLDEINTENDRIKTSSLTLAIIIGCFCTLIILLLFANDTFYIFNQEFYAGVFFIIIMLASIHYTIYYLILAYQLEIIGDALKKDLTETDRMIQETIVKRDDIVLQCCNLVEDYPSLADEPFIKNNELIQKSINNK